jgi:hypothetical protein
MEYWLKRHGHPPSISVQHLLDCAGKKSCEEGGLMSTPAHFWARFSGHGLLVMKSSAKDAGQAYLRG